MQDSIFLMMKTTKALRNAFDKKLKASEVTAIQFSVMNYMCYSNNKLTSAEIANGLNSDRATISGIIRRLEKNKFIIRLKNEEDRRSEFLELTRLGKESVVKQKEIADELSRYLFGNLSDERKNSFNEELNLILDKLETMNE